MGDQQGNPTLHQLLKQEQIEIDHHESDLYFPVNAKTTAILLRFPLEFKISKRFRDNRNELCYEVPFAYDPFWER